MSLHSRASLVSLVLVCAGCQMQNYAQRGAAVGGLTGGGLGAVVGELAGDKPVVGAAIGSAVGAFTGASMGTALDEIDARNEARVQQAVYAQRAGETSLQEVLAMSNAGLGDEVITRHLRTHGFNRELDAGDLIALRQQGVSDRVITALQEATASTLRMAPAPAPAPAPLMMSAPAVIVEERYHAMPYPWYPRRHYRRGCPGPPGPGFHWGVTFGH